MSQNIERWQQELSDLDTKIALLSDELKGVRAFDVRQTGFYDLRIKAENIRSNIALFHYRPSPRPDFQPAYIETYREQSGFENVKRFLVPFCNEGLKVHFNEKTWTVTYGEGVSTLRKLTRGPLNFPSRLDPIYLSTAVESLDVSPIKNRQEQLLKAARKFFSSHLFEQQPLPIAYGDCPMDDEALISQCLDNQKGLCIGEVHNRTVGRAFLIRNMQRLRELGVETLFMEFLHYDTMQPLLDEYYRSDQRKLSGFLATFLTTLQTGFHLGLAALGIEFENQTYIHLVEAAKKAGIRIVGIDTVISQECGMTSFGATGEDRSIAMNYVASRIIEQEYKNKPFVALMGSSHLKASERGTPGVPQILGTPSLDFHLSSMLEGKPNSHKS